MNSLAIIHEDSSLIILNKLALIHSVSQSPGDYSIAQKLIEYLPELEEASEKRGDAGLINRLDFETSGVLIAAKNRAVWLALRAQFNDRQITKIYRALLEGEPQHPLVIEGYIGNRYRGSKKVTVQEKDAPRFSFARTEIIKLLSFDQKENCSLVELKASTGARHQIRAHCASIGHPLVGDSLYGAKKNTPFYLHALKVEFVHPATNTFFCAIAPEPERKAP